VCGKRRGSALEEGGRRRLNQRAAQKACRVTKGPSAPEYNARREV